MVLKKYPDSLRVRIQVKTTGVRDAKELLLQETVSGPQYEEEWWNERLGL